MSGDPMIFHVKWNPKKNIYVYLLTEFSGISNDAATKIRRNWNPMFFVRLALASQNVLVCNGILCMHGNPNYSNSSGTTATRVVIVVHRPTRDCARRCHTRGPLIGFVAVPSMQGRSFVGAQPGHGPPSFSDM
jgi:hypothetical protein